MMATPDMADLSVDGKEGIIEEQRYGTLPALASVKDDLDRKGPLTGRSRVYIIRNNTRNE